MARVGKLKRKFKVFGTRIRVIRSRFLRCSPSFIRFFMVVSCVENFILPVSIVERICLLTRTRFNIWDHILAIDTRIYTVGELKRFLSSFSEVLFHLRYFQKKCFPSTPKRKASVFKFLRFEEHSRKAAFS